MVKINWHELWNLAHPGIMNQLKRKGRNYACLSYTREDNNTVIAEAIVQSPAGASTTTMVFTFKYIIDSIPKKTLKELPYFKELEEIVNG